MALIRKHLAERVLRSGTSDQLVQLRSGDLSVGDDEYRIELVFSDGVSIDQVIADRDRVRDNFYELAEKASVGGWIPTPYFSLAEERDLLELANEHYE